MTAEDFGRAQASPADRENAQSVLQQARNEGRLSQADFDTRMAQLPLAQTPDELSRLTADLGQPAWGMAPGQGQPYAPTQGFPVGQGYGPGGYPADQASPGQGYAPGQAYAPPGQGIPGQAYAAPGQGIPGQGYAPGQGYPVGQGYPPPQGYLPGQGYPQRRTNQLAIAALVCGVAQVFFWLLTGIPAIIFGHLARKQIKQTGEDGDGMALTGLILGYIGVVLSVVGIVALIILGFVVHSAVVHSQLNVTPGNGFGN